MLVPPESQLEKVMQRRFRHKKKKTLTRKNLQRIISSWRIKLERQENPGRKRTSCDLNALHLLFIHTRQLHIRALTTVTLVWGQTTSTPQVKLSLPHQTCQGVFNHKSHSLYKHRLYVMLQVTQWTHFQIKTRVKLVFEHRKRRTVGSHFNVEEVVLIFRSEAQVFSRQLGTLISNINKQTAYDDTASTHQSTGDRPG